MQMLIIPIVFVIIILVIFIIAILMMSRQEKVYKTIDEKGKIKQNNMSNEKNKSKNIQESEAKKEKYKKEEIFKFMEFDKIMDNMIVQNDGSRFTMAIQCKGINYDLMSEVEQLSVEEGFITFLNTLKYPIQIYVQAQNIDLKGNVQRYRENIAGLTEDYNAIIEKYNNLAGTFDVDEVELENVTKEKDRITNVYEYANDIIKYVEKMNTNKSLLQRKFFVLLSYNTSEINAADKFNKDELIDMCSTELTTRCRGIISALSSCSVSGKILDSTELADLLYSAYNRDDKSLLSVKDAVDAGMLRLYSTSYDAFLKKQEQLEEYLKSKAKLKAYKAIQYAKEHNQIETTSSEYLEEETEISRRATNYIKNSDFSEEEKEIATKKILSDYREDKQTLQEFDEAQKQAILERAEEDIKQIPELEKVEVPIGVQLLEKSKNMNSVVNSSTIDNKDESENKEDINQSEENNTNINDDNIKTDRNVNSDTSNDDVDDKDEEKINIYDEENDSIV